MLASFDVLHRLEGLEGDRAAAERVKDEERKARDEREAVKVKQVGAAAFMRQREGRACGQSPRA